MKPILLLILTLLSPCAYAQTWSTSTIPLDTGSNWTEQQVGRDCVTGRMSVELCQRYLGGRTFIDTEVEMVRREAQPPAARGSATYQCGSDASCRYGRIK